MNTTFLMNLSVFKFCVKNSFLNVTLLFAIFNFYILPHCPLFAREVLYEVKQTVLVYTPTHLLSILLETQGFAAYAYGQNGGGSWMVQGTTKQKNIQFHMKETSCQ